VEDTYAGPTNENRKTVTGLRPGDKTIQVFAEGYERLTSRITLKEGAPTDQKFSLKRSLSARQDSAKASLLKAITALGGIDGLVELADVEGDGTMQWTNASNSTEQWSISFNKRPGRDISATFKTNGGQCTASILVQTAKQDCRGELKNRGEKIAEQGATLLLSYQLQDVLQAILKRPVVTSEANENRLESIDSKDSYVLTVGPDGLPAELIYSVGSTEQPIRVQYANYVKLTRGWYPAKISVGRVDTAPAWVFTLKSIHGRSVR
jgi:hypothetical protein